MSTAYSYIRWSTKAQGAEGRDSLRRQLSRAMAYADKHKLRLDVTHRDEGVSSYHGEHRLKGALASFLRSVEEGEITRGSYLLIDAFDRLGRESETQMLHLLTGITLRGIKVVTLMDERVYDDKARPEELIAALISISRAHEESVRKGDLVKDARTKNKLRAREEGVVWHSTGPQWLRRDGPGWEVIPERVEIVQRIFAMIEAGLGTTAIAQQFNAEGIQTSRHGHGWHHSGILEIAKNRAVLGEYQPKLCIANNRSYGRPADGPPIAGYYIPIISQEQFDRVQLLISARRGKPRADQRLMFSNLFLGMVKCGKCGGRIGIHVSTKGRNSALRCGEAARGRCDNRTRYAYERLEAAVLKTVTTFEAPTPQDGGHADLIARETIRRDALKGRLESLLSTASDFGPTVLAWVAKQEAEIEAVDERIAKLQAVKPAKPLRDRQAALKTMMEGLASDDDRTLYDLRSRLHAALKNVISEMTCHPNGEVAVTVLNGAMVHIFRADGTEPLTFNLVHPTRPLPEAWSQGDTSKIALLEEMRASAKSAA